MKTNHLLIWVGTILVAVAIIAIAIVQSTDPYRGYDFDRKDSVTPAPVTSYIPAPDKYPNETVYDPMTGEYITPEQAEMRQETLEALLCSMGEEVYCSD